MRGRDNFLPVTSTLRRGYMDQNRAWGYFSPGNRLVWFGRTILDEGTSGFRPPKWRSFLNLSVLTR